jgi:hypothetical protein
LLETDEAVTIRAVPTPAHGRRACSWADGHAFGLGFSRVAAHCHVSGLSLRTGATGLLCNEALKSHNAGGFELDATRAVVAVVD